MNCALIKQNPDGSYTIFYKGERIYISPEEAKKIEKEQDENQDT